MSETEKTEVENERIEPYVVFLLGSSVRLVVSKEEISVEFLSDFDDNWYTSERISWDKWERIVRSIAEAREMLCRINREG